jgi:P-type Ca2+ transporter type 2C
MVDVVRVSFTESHSQPSHARSAEEVAGQFGTDLRQGLSAAKVISARAAHGLNELAEAPPIPLWRKFLAQFQELVIWILIIAAIISGLLGEWTDALAILAIVLLNGILGFIQEQKAERALAALQQMSAPMAKVVRDGVPQVIQARDLVPGDHIELEGGDNIPADARLIEAFGFRVLEATLTGESAPEEKDAAGSLDPATPLGDRRNMVFMGTIASAGKASAIVTATGMKTELGHIAGMLQRTEAEPTPLQKRLAEMGRILAIACLGIVAVVFVLEWITTRQFLEVFLLSVSLAVAAVPESLPAVVTIALALGLQRMIKRNALIRKLPSVETLGSVTVICSDKTGTLTKNEMTVREVFAGGNIYQVTGAGYAPQGDFLKGANGEIVKPSSDADLMQALEIGVRCNNAALLPRGKATEGWQVIGDPTEGALLVVGLKAGIQSSRQSAPVLLEIPFDSDRKAMSVVVRQGDEAVLHIKGAPEVILGKCIGEQKDGQIVPLDAAGRQHILDVGAEMANRALRVLAVACRRMPAAEFQGQVAEENLVFAGLMGMIDPPREEVKDSVRRCHEAGIRPVMITGDHPATAMAIARELLIAREGDQVVTGQQLTQWSEDELAARVASISVYARVTAEHKLRIVRAWKKNGQVVAMTGDGVNDAPAIKAADIGIAMGVTGTDVTKEASAMVLTDDNFVSIVNAVEEGRGIYDNIQKVLQFLLSCNLGEILLVLLTSLIGWPAPLLPVQLLWINLVTDGLPAIALALEPPEPGIMRRKPRPPGESILSWTLGLRILFQGLMVCGASLAAFAITYAGQPENLPRARTMAFCVLVYAELLRALAARSQSLTMFQLGVFTNPYLWGAIGISALLQLSIVTLPFARPVFEAVQHFQSEWWLLIGLALIPFVAFELFKWARQKFADLSSQP